MKEVRLSIDEAVNVFERWMRGALLEIRAALVEHDEDLAEAYFQMRKPLYDQAVLSIRVGMDHESIAKEQMVVCADLCEEFGESDTAMVFAKLIGDAMVQYG